jgi:hypothetical protein
MHFCTCIQFFSLCFGPGRNVGLIPFIGPCRDSVISTSASSSQEYLVSQKEHFAEHPKVLTKTVQDPWPALQHSPFTDKNIDVIFIILIPYKYIMPVKQNTANKIINMNRNTSQFSPDLKIINPAKGMTIKYQAANIPIIPPINIIIKVMGSIIPSTP